MVTVVRVRPCSGSAGSWCWPCRRPWASSSRRSRRAQWWRGVRIAGWLRSRMGVGPCGCGTPALRRWSTSSRLNRSAELASDELGTRRSATRTQAPRADLHPPSNGTERAPRDDPADGRQDVETLVARTPGGPDVGQTAGVRLGAALHDRRPCPVPGGCAGQVRDDAQACSSAADHRSVRWVGVPAVPVRGDHYRCRARTGLGAHPGPRAAGAMGRSVHPDHTGTPSLGRAARVHLRAGAARAPAVRHGHVGWRTRARGRDTDVRAALPVR